VSGAERDYEDGPSVETEACDLGGCCEPWAWETDRRNGPRKLRLCEEHADRWLKSERDLNAELEEVAGRRPKPLPLSDLFGLVRALDGRTRRSA
jgi:hypothetical protein